VGRLQQTSIDLLSSSVRASFHDARTAEGTRVLAYLGLVTSSVPARGLAIEEVRPGSLAERAGIVVGDVLAEVDGVHALEAADVLPTSARTTEVLVRHADSGLEETKTFSMMNYASGRVPSEYASALLVVGLAISLLLMLVLPGPASLAAFELTIARRIRKTTLRAALAALVGSGITAAVGVLASAVLAGFALAPYVVARELDAVMLFATASSMLVWSRATLERGVGDCVRTVLGLLAAIFVMGAALVVTAFQVGAIELAEIVRVQGGAPWEFTATRHPACALLLLVYGGALSSILRTRASAPGRRLLLERTGLLFASAGAVMAFLGGWQIPGVPEPKTRLLLLVAAALFVTKTWLVSALLLASSRVATTLQTRDVVRIVVRWLAPLLVLAAVFFALSRRVVPNGTVELSFAGTLVALATLFLVRLAARVRAALARPEPQTSPFL
jgi:hypothetical protein